MSKLILVRAKRPATEPLDWDPQVTLSTVPHDCAVFCFVIGKSDIIGVNEIEPGAGEIEH